MTDPQTQTTSMPTAEARTTLRRALLDGRAAIAEFVNHAPTLRGIDDVLAADPDLPALRAEIREVCSFLFVEAPVRSRDAVAALRATLDATRQPLACPDCGGTISPIIGHTGSGYLSSEVVTGFECDDFRCGAEWNRAGSVTTGE